MRQLFTWQLKLVFPAVWFSLTWSLFPCYPKATRLAVFWQVSTSQHLHKGVTLTAHPACFPKYNRQDLLPGKCGKARSSVKKKKKTMNPELEASFPSQSPVFLQLTKKFCAKCNLKNRTFQVLVRCSSSDTAKTKASLCLNSSPLTLQEPDTFSSKAISDLN